MKNQSILHNSALLSIALMALAFLFAAPLHAQSPRISVQGTLKSSSGATVDDGNYDVVFNLYNQETGGTALWSDPATVEVVGGVYNYYLGSNTPLVAAHFDSTLYLGVKIGNYELVPRTEFSYAPYAFSVAVAQKVVCSGAVGDVKYSILEPTKFAEVNGPCWVPMDGRPITQYQLFKRHGISTIPDAGGLFIRAQEFSGGANHDPDRNSNSPIATIQADSLKSHAHTMSKDGKHSHKITLGHDDDDSGDGGSEDDWTQKTNVGVDITMHGGSVSMEGEHSHTINATGHLETRPKNINLWIYIRVD